MYSTVCSIRLVSRLDSYFQTRIRLGLDQARPVPTSNQQPEQFIREEQWFQQEGEYMGMFNFFIGLCITTSRGTCSYMLPNKSPFSLNVHSLLVAPPRDLQQQSDPGRLRGLRRERDQPEHHTGAWQSCLPVLLCHAEFSPEINISL